MARETGRTPPALQRWPLVEEGRVLYWEAFQMLSSSRPQTGFGPVAIPMTEILAYADLLGWRGLEQRQDLVRFIRALDQAYIAHMSQKT